MRDIQQVLERWGAWVANNHEDVTWSSIAAGFKGLIPSKVKSRPQLKWHTEFGHLNRGDMLTSEQ
uniref:antiterminator Q family protein n=1 Tax=Shigella flexneri TaxID=623 RepID=UPI0025B0D27C